MIFYVFAFIYIFLFESDDNKDTEINNSVSNKKTIHDTILFPENKQYNKVEKIITRKYLIKLSNPLSVITSKALDKTYNNKFHYKLDTYKIVEYRFCLSSSILENDDLKTFYLN